MKTLKKEILIDDETKSIIIGNFDKQFKNDKYELLFNTKTGFEVLRGINGNNDPFVTDLPTMIDVGIMGHCSNKCHFCYQGDNQQPNMKLDDFKKIIDETKHHVNQVALGGRGDPNLHENFKEIIEYCNKNNVVPNYTTSGRNLTDEQIEISKGCGAVAISDYDQLWTYQALNKFINAGIKTNIHVIFSSESFTRCMNILFGIDIWNQKIDVKKLNAVIFLLFKPQGRGKNLQQWIPSREQLKRFAKMIKKPYCAFQVGLDSCMVNKIKSFAHFTEYEKMFIDTCEGSRMSAYISPDMKLLPCSFGDSDKYGISLENKSIEKVWNNGDIFLEFRNLLKSNSNECPYGL